MISTLATPKPFTKHVLLDDDPINDRQIWFMLGNEGAGSTVKNIARLRQPGLNPALFDGTLQAGMSWATDQLGWYTKGNGGATGYVDLGTTQPQNEGGTTLVGSAGPATVMWVETVDPAATISGFYGVWTIGNGSTIFVALKNDTGAYSTLTVGSPGTTNNQRFSTAPTLASGKGISRVWVFRAPNGMASNSTGHKLTVDGVDYGTSTLGSGNSLGTFTGNNRLGWDSADPKFPGGVHCARLWNRVLSDSEVLRLCQDPAAGTRRRNLFKAPSQRYERMFIAM